MIIIRILSSHNSRINAFQILCLKTSHFINQSINQSIPVVIQNFGVSFFVIYVMKENQMLRGASKFGVD